MAYREDTNATLIITIGVVSGLVLVTLAVGVQAWFLYEEETEINAKWAANTDTKLKDLHEEQLNNISSYHWVDKDKKIAAIPIEQAMQVVVRNKGKLSQ